MSEYGKGPVENMIDKGLLKLEQENAELCKTISILNDNDNALRKQIEAMKNCDNCEWKINCLDQGNADCNEGKYENWQMKGAE
jgi:hypothetical protein